jgi:hypothetical protein
MFIIKIKNKKMENLLKMEDIAYRVKFSPTCQVSPGAIGPFNPYRVDTLKF